MASVKGGEFDGIMGADPGGVVPDKAHGKAGAPPAAKKPMNRKALYFGGAAVLVVGMGAIALFGKKEPAAAPTELDSVISAAVNEAKAKEQMKTNETAGGGLKTPKTASADQSPTVATQAIETVTPDLDAAKPVNPETVASPAQVSTAVNTSAEPGVSGTTQPMQPAARAEPPKPESANQQPTGIVQHVANSAPTVTQELADTRKRLREAQARLSAEQRKSARKVTVVAVLADGVVLKDSSGKEHVVAVGGAL